MFGQVPLATKTSLGKFAVGARGRFPLGQVLRKTKRPLDASLRAESTKNGPAPRRRTRTNYPRNRTARRTPFTMATTSRMKTTTRSTRPSSLPQSSTKSWLVTSPRSMALATLSMPSFMRTRSNYRDEWQACPQAAPASGWIRSLPVGAQRQAQAYRNPPRRCRAPQPCRLRP